MSYYGLHLNGSKTEHVVKGSSPTKALRELCAAAGVTLASQSGRYGKLDDGTHAMALTQAWGRADAPDARTTRTLR